jgi:pyrimidine-nucleoside phosphorylase
MTIIEIIETKKQGHPLTEEMIQFFIQGYTKGNIPDYQISALLMAIYFQGMNDEEATFLALAMRDSGDSIDLSSIEGIKVDKHSTGGVGDKISFILGPMVAHFGLKLAKMSGRGLGHTGGTIDKLESIHGIEVVQTEETFKKQVQKHHLAIIGQSGDIAPADKMLYALRDVTSTVNSMPLIAASIMSKKLASGADIIVLDVKVGDGAFMKTIEEARSLATLMVEIGKLANKKMIAIVTNMDEPLGHFIGNAHEIHEAVQTLLGKGPDDLNHIASTLVAHLLVQSDLYQDFDIAYDASRLVLKKGLAYPYFKRMIEDQKGDSEMLVTMPLYFASNQKQLKAKKTGFIDRIEALKIGKAAMLLGAGRQTKEDRIDYYVGLELHKKVGDYVHEGDILVTIYHHDKGLEEAIQFVEDAFSYNSEAKILHAILDTIQ